MQEMRMEIERLRAEIAGGVTHPSTPSPSASTNRRRSPREKKSNSPVHSPESHGRGTMHEHGETGAVSSTGPVITPDRSEYARANTTDAALREAALAAATVSRVMSQATSSRAPSISAGIISPLAAS